MADRRAVGGSLLQAAVGLLAVMTLDMSWPLGVVFAVLLGVAAVRSGSVESGVLILWVAAAAAAFLVLGAESLTGDVLHPLTRLDRKSTRLNSSHVSESRMPSSA